MVKTKLGTYVDKNAHRLLKQMAAQEETTQSALLEKIILDYFTKNHKEKLANTEEYKVY